MTAKKPPRASLRRWVTREYRSSPSWKFRRMSASIVEVIERTRARSALQLLATSTS
jgi:hypothetical protein